MSKTRSPGSRRRPVVRRLAAAAVIVTVLATLVGIAAELNVMRRVERIHAAFDGLPERPAPASGETILLVGTWQDGGADVPWLEGSQSVESVMLVEVAADRGRVRFESVPEEEIRDAVITPEPSEVVAAVESWSGRRVDHLMAIDWGAFARLAADNDVEASYDQGSPVSLQHDYLREVLAGTLHQELRKRPLDLYRQLTTIADGAALDDDWSLVELNLFVVSLRNLRSRHIEFAMAQPA